MTHNDDDVKTWVAEWRLWGGVSIVVVLAWGAWCLMRGSFDTFWPLGALAVWAAVLLAAPLWPSPRNRNTSDDGSRPDPDGGRGV